MIDVKKPAHSVTVAPSTQEMAKDLLNISNRTSDKNNYRNISKANKYLSEGRDLPIDQKVGMVFNAAYQALLGGDTNSSLGILQELKKEIEATGYQMEQASILNLNQLYGLAYMRKGEVENCIANHNEDMCILPLNKNSFHVKPKGSRTAIQIFNGLLNTGIDGNTLWLLNLAHMTLGEYPNGVPSQWRIPLTPNEERGLIPEFKNVASGLGIDDNQLSGGVVVDDLNGDGHYDIMCSSWDLRDQIKLYINNGNGGFSERHQEAGLKGITGGLNLTHGDYNNDGHLDILVLRGAWLEDIGAVPNSLLKNDGKGGFTDVTKEAGLYSLKPTQTAAWADFNNDGHLDIFIGNESTKNTNNPCELFINDGKGYFTDMAGSAGVDKQGFVKGVATADYDNDGDQDIYISMLGEKNVFLRNDTESGIVKFSDVSIQTGTQKPLGSFPCWFFDVDNDGLEDLFVSGYGMDYYTGFAAEYVKELTGDVFSMEHPRLYKNKGDGSFEDVSEAYGLKKVCATMGCSFGDLNNDGYLDFYLATGEPDMKAIIPNRMFYNLNGQEFKEVTTQGGFGHLQKGHAVAFADIDNDGDQDVYTVLGGAYEGDKFYNALFENPGTNNHWIKLKLEGTASNKIGYGTKIKLSFVWNGFQNSIYRTISSGASFGETPVIAEIGLPSGAENIELELRWPSGTNTTYSSLKHNTFYKATEGDAALSKLELRATKLKAEDSGGHHHHH